MLTVSAPTVTAALDHHDEVVAVSVPLVLLLTLRSHCGALSEVPKLPLRPLICQFTCSPQLHLVRHLLDWMRLLNHRSSFITRRRKQVVISVESIYRVFSRAQVDLRSCFVMLNRRSVSFGRRMLRQLPASNQYFVCRVPSRIGRPVSSSRSSSSRCLGCCYGRVGSPHETMIGGVVVLLRRRCDLNFTAGSRRCNLLGQRLLLLPEQEL